MGAQSTLAPGTGLGLEGAGSHPRQSGLAGQLVHVWEHLTCSHSMHADWGEQVGPEG